MKYKHIEIYWSPFATNVLDAGEYDLRRPDGSPVKFYRSNGGFVLEFGDERYETQDNLQMSYWMNQLQIGGTLKPKF